MKDSVRYTYQFDGQRYADGVADARAGLQDAGYQEIKFKNTWGEEGYQGINGAYRTPDGSGTIEVQFHTPESLETKMTGHDLYEERRLPETTPERVAELDRQMAEQFERVPELPHPSDLGAVQHPRAGPSTPAAPRRVRREAWMSRTETRDVLLRGAGFRAGGLPRLLRAGWSTASRTTGVAGRHRRVGETAKLSSTASTWRRTSPADHRPARRGDPAEGAALVVVAPVHPGGRAGRRHVTHDPAGATDTPCGCAGREERCG